MVRDLINRLAGAASAAAVVLTLSAILAGCGSEQVDSSAVPPPPKAEANVPAAGPAISGPLTFDQLALDSPVKRVQTKQGIVYLHFSFTDRSGKVYKCELPEAQSKGSHTRDEWLAVFNAYRLPTVVKQKAPPKNPLTVADFPFISPRPGATASASSQENAPPAPESDDSPARPMPPAPIPPGSGRGDQD